MANKMVIFSAPSGSGKTTIIKEVLKEDFAFEFSVSACNRPPREGEVHGKDYYFLSDEEFRTKIENNEFIEWEEVYQGRFYGTLRSEINRIWEKGKNVIFDVDVLGGVNIKNQFNDIAMSIFIRPPSIAELERRLTKRGTDPAVEIDRRIAKASEELKYAIRFDKVIVNDTLETAILQTKDIIRNFLEE